MRCPRCGTEMWQKLGPVRKEKWGDVLVQDWKCYNCDYEEERFVSK